LKIEEELQETKNRLLITKPSNNLLREETHKSIIA